MMPTRHVTGRYRGASDTENSIIAMGRSLIVENNYGYDLQKWNDVIGGGVQIGGDLNLVSSPGMIRVDVNNHYAGIARVSRLRPPATRARSTAPPARAGRRGRAGRPLPPGGP